MISEGGRRLADFKALSEIIFKNYIMSVWLSNTAWLLDLNVFYWLL